MAAGSIAAALQSWMGTIGAGSAFAGLQSIGALGGLSTATSATIGATAAAGAALRDVLFDSATRTTVDKVFGAAANIWNQENEQIQKKQTETPSKSVYDNDHGFVMEGTELEQWFERELKFQNEKDRDRYLQLFVEHGFDSMEIIEDINEEDLDAMGITKKGHRKYILKKIRQLH